MIPAITLRHKGCYKAEMEHRGGAFTKRVIPVLILLSAGSGCAALIYEIVWFQLLQFVIGSSAASLGVLLTTFMGGMCLGSLLLPRVFASRRHPLRIFALLELGIGCFGVFVLVITPYVGMLYARIATPEMPGMLLRATIGMAILLPPTILMGATLPALARWVDASPRGTAQIGSIYAANIAGAVFGCLVSGFYLLRLYDSATASYVAVAINSMVALSAAALGAVTVYDPPGGKWPESPAHLARVNAVYIAIALSGLTALAAEVTWTRVLALLFGPSVYTFSIILAVFLLGMGLGSAACSSLVPRLRDPGKALGACQAMLAAAIAWSAYTISAALPYWPIYPPLAPSPSFVFQVDFFSSVVAIMPAAIFWGASFPLALAAVADGKDPGRTTAAVYGANTVGAIVGALGFSMIVVPEFGPQRAQQLLILLTTVAALLMWASSLPVLSARTQRSNRASNAGHPVFDALRIVTVPLVAAVLIWSVPDVPDKLIAFGRNMFTAELSKVLFRGDGRVSSVAVTERDSIRSFHVAGKVEASTALNDMRLQRLLGHLSALLHPRPRSILVAGFGAGVTAGSFVLHPDVERIVICEIEPIIPSNVGPYFSDVNYDVLRDPRVTVVYDDARHYVLTTKEKFDVITSDPITPWVRGAAMLYTQEYFELAKQRLNPGGVITQWVPLYESTLATVKSEIATFFKVFPGGTIWSNHLDGRGYDLVLYGQAAPATIDLDELNQRLRRPDHRRVTASLIDVQISALSELLATYVTQHNDLTTWLADAEINTDRNLRLQYLAGLGLNRKEEHNIYMTLRGFQTLSPKIFTGSQQSIEVLNGAISRPSGSRE